MAKLPSILRRLVEHARCVWDESLFRTSKPISRLNRFAHFWVMVGKSFSRNHCPIRASALAYATLLAMIPMLAIAMSIASTFLKNEGEERIDQFIGKIVDSLVPQATLTTDAAAAETEPADENPAVRPLEPATAKPGGTDLATLTQDARVLKTRKEAARVINEFIQNTRSGALGVMGSVVLIFAAISMLSRIECTFNDIWGVARGRSWFMRVVLYWGLLSLLPLFVIVAVGLASGPHLAATRQLLASTPWLSSLLFQLLPVLVLCLTFALFYLLMPNTKVEWGAALVGGFTAGVLFHLNNVVNVLYVSRVVSNSKIYGSLGLVPVIMIGLYFAWLIVLFGAQVSYAFQNRITYLEERQAENINQRGREFIALRLMTLVSQRFVRGECPPDVAELARDLAVPTRLIQQILRILASARLVVETAGLQMAYVPARPIETITCHDILLAMRATQGEDLATRDEPARAEVYGEFHRIQEAERQAAASVSMLALVNRTGEHPALPEGRGQG
jgi:membrane protein